MQPFAQVHGTLSAHPAGLDDILLSGSHYYAVIVWRKESVSAQDREVGKEFLRRKARCLMAGGRGGQLCKLGSG